VTELCSKDVMHALLLAMKVVSGYNQVVCSSINFNHSLDGHQRQVLGLR
jgi:hypothetical protein